VLNRDGKETTPIMGSYGIGVERILTAAIEQSAASLPRAASPMRMRCQPIAPFQVVVTVTNVRSRSCWRQARRIAQQLTRGIRRAAG
jgi:prolyl-tRNA synthetase